jgi:hypothetical protein
MAGCYENGNEPLRAVKGEEFLNYLCYCQLIKKDSAPLI